MVCVAACSSNSTNAATLGSVAALTGSMLALAGGVHRSNILKQRFQSVVVYANDVIVVTPAAGSSFLGQKNVTYTISNLADYIVGVTLQASWPALFACDASTPVGQAAGVIKQYPVIPAVPCVRDCKEQAFFEALGEGSTLNEAVRTGIAAYLSRLGGYGTEGASIEELGTDISKRPALALWTNFRNVAMIDCAQIRFNNVVADTLTKESIFVLDEAYSTSGARIASVSGGFDTIEERVIASQQAQCYFTPLPFWFSRKINLTEAGSSLATASGLYTQTTVNCSFLPADLLIQVSKPGLVVQNFSTAQPVRDQDVSITLLVETVQVEVTLRDTLALAAYTTAYAYTSMQTYTNLYSNIILDMKNAVREFHVLMRMEGATANFDYFNFSGLACQKPFTSVTLSFNSITRIAALSVDASVATQQFCGYYNVKDLNRNFIFFFAFNVSNLQTGYPGATSFDAYQTIKASITLAPGISEFNYQLFFISRSYNLIRHVDSTMGTVYSVNGGN
jgi:hypothetical protein